MINYRYNRNHASHSPGKARASVLIFVSRPDRPRCLRRDACTMHYLSPPPPFPTTTSFHPSVSMLNLHYQRPPILRISRPTRQTSPVHPSLRIIGVSCSRGTHYNHSARQSATAIFHSGSPFRSDIPSSMFLTLFICLHRDRQPKYPDVEESSCMYVSRRLSQRFSMQSFRLFCF